jgi:hypothetical protein
VTKVKRLKKFASNPWVLSCTSFMLTALLIRLDTLNVL